MSTLRNRRTHTKSRGGCFECKRRKIKCDEGKPVCAGCIKRETTCTYPDEIISWPPQQENEQRSSSSLRPEPRDWGPTSAPSPQGSSTKPSALGDSAPASFPAETVASLGETSAARLGVFDMEDMTLWHHFIKSTAETISSPWGEELPQLALSCDYLLHGILAAAALHLAFLYPELHEKYNFLATIHQDLAIGPFQRAMKDITTENGNQLFAFSTLLIVFNFASSRAPEELLPSLDGGSQTGIANWISCLRGCYSIHQAARLHIQAGPLGFLITEGRKLFDVLSSGIVPLPEDDKSLLQITEGVMMLPSVRSSTTLDEMDSYVEAIAKLRNYLAVSTMDQSPVMRRAITSMWAATISETFIRLLREKRPPALIIMAHFCILLERADNCWYISGRAVALFTTVDQTLDAEWAGYIEHPRRIIMGS
ncbi:hypothetical protein GQ53DRAFT_672670 [Thozetella sp. PMI_491]|nr:hypothetical protein GQ53DRAFT_672670 [Thozetella sp. PMI_491]